MSSSSNAARELKRQLNPQGQGSPIQSFTNITSLEAIKTKISVDHLNHTPNTKKLINISQNSSPQQSKVSPQQSSSSPVQIHGFRVGRDSRIKSTSSSRSLKKDTHIENIIQKYLSHQTRENCTKTNDIHQKTEITTMFHHQQKEIDPQTNALYKSFVETYAKACNSSNEKTGSAKKNDDSPDTSDHYTDLKNQSQIKQEFYHIEEPSLVKKLNEEFISPLNVDHQKSMNEGQKKIILVANKGLNSSASSMNPIPINQPSPLSRVSDKTSQHSIDSYPMETIASHKPTEINLSEVFNRPKIAEIKTQVSGSPCLEHQGSNTIISDKFDQSPILNLSPILTDGVIQFDPIPEANDEKQIDFENQHDVNLDQGFLQNDAPSETLPENILTDNEDYQQPYQDVPCRVNLQAQINLSNDLSIIEEEDEIKSAPITNENTKSGFQPQALFDRLDVLLSDLDTKIEQSSYTTQQMKKIQQIRQKHCPKKSEEDKFLDFHECNIQDTQEQLKEPQFVQDIHQVVESKALITKDLVIPPPTERLQEIDVKKTPNLSLVGTKIVSRLNVFTSMIVVLLLIIILLQIRILRS